ncbi:ABC transporter permease [Alkaliphilus oremlandii]|uniref:ABC3 transporter permease C-terminal domain-containing protein n=1 Tax=Alkaliphilus oremlandii (strain OhILAs) TaxID=350688 RepID=A8MK17_ALKOO|nr:FtsX-like permease family protein [Alkaliphilus oremlandii]ABW20149.1 protein of unknown function DUF214 [Alkaliphilus oremlandii OhILAs]
MKKLDVRLLRLIKNSKGQFISISVTIVLALTIYISFSMVADNLNNSILQYYEATNFADVFVEVSKIPKTAIDQLLDIDGIEMAQGRVSADVPLRVANPKEKVTVRMVSLPKEENILNNVFTLEGEELEEHLRTTVVLGQFFDARGMALGDKIIPYIGGTEYALDVIGVVGSPEYIYLMENEQALLPAPEKFGVIYVTDEFAQSSLGFQGSYNEVVIKIDENYRNKIHSIVDAIEDELDRYGVKRIVKREDQLSHSMMMQEVESLETMASSITFLFLMVAGVIINIMLSRIVKNDRIYIGIMKALGYSNSDILSHYTKYSILIGLAGSVIGMILSIPLSVLFTNLYMVYMNIPMFKTKIYYIYFVYGIGLTSIFCILSGLIGARSVLKIFPADAMKPEAPKVGKRFWLEKVKFIWSKISFSWKMVIRNIARNKRRAVFLVLGIALTYSITMVPVFMSSVFDSLFTMQYGELQTMDYNIDFAVPMDRNALLELSKLIDIDYMEPKTEVPLELSRGWRKKAVSVIGIPRDTQLYNFKNLSGVEIKLPQEGIVLSKILAETLDVKIGDEIVIKSFMPDHEEKIVVVKDIIIQYLGSNGYMDIHMMNNVLGEKGVITGALLNANDDVVTKLQNIKNIKQIQSIEDMKNSILEFMDMIIYSMGTMMIFGGILGFAIVYNITIISISERTMEFSSLRVMGFDKKDIYKLITRENGLMALLGIALGMPLGYGMCKGMASAVSTEIYNIPVIISLKSYIITAIATVIFVAVAQLSTIRKIHKLNFMDALKNRVS